MSISTPQENKSQELDLNVVAKQSIENTSKIEQIKKRISKEIENIEKSIDEIEKLKDDSIEKIEAKKRELQEISENENICEQYKEMLQEITTTGKEIEDQKHSITILDRTITELDNQIAKIQARHDVAISDLEKKRARLNARLEYYEMLNEKLRNLTKLIEEQTKQYEEKINNLMRQRSALLKRTDLSETTLNRMLAELDAEIAQAQKEHEEFLNELAKAIPLLEPEMEEEEIVCDLLTEDQIRDLEKFEAERSRKMTDRERRRLLRMGLQITPSGRIITKDDRVITIEEARRLGLFGYYGEYGEDMESFVSMEEEMEEIEIMGEMYSEKELIYGSISSPISSSIDESSLESGLSEQDIEYLKQVFGKSLTLALAEITAVQPSDPIHYLAHWLFKYRYNQEIDEVKQKEIKALMAERERLAAEKWHAELEEEAKLAIFEALFRAENIILQQEFERIAMEQLEMEGEYEM